MHPTGLDIDKHMYALELPLNSSSDILCSITFTEQLYKRDSSLWITNLPVLETQWHTMQNEADALDLVNCLKYFSQTGQLDTRQMSESH